MAGTVPGTMVLVFSDGYQCSLKLNIPMSKLHKNVENTVENKTRGLAL